MASYIEITDAEVDPEAPITSYLGYRWRDNPIAIAERATGAPRVKVPTIEQITGSGNWTVPDGVTRVKVTCIGGGGGAWSNGVGGGGGGGTAIGFLEVVPGTNIAYEVGARGVAQAADGEDTIFDSVPIAGGPILGGGGITATSGGGGAGGTASGGVINAVGGPGFRENTGNPPIGFGGLSMMWNQGRQFGVGLSYGGGGDATAAAISNGAGGTIILEY